MALTTRSGAGPTDRCARDRPECQPLDEGHPAIRAARAALATLVLRGLSAAASRAADGAASCSRWPAAAKWRSSCARFSRREEDGGQFVRSSGNRRPRPPQRRAAAAVPRARRASPRRARGRRRSAARAAAWSGQPGTAGRSSHAGRATCPAREQTRHAHDQAGPQHERERRAAPTRTSPLVMSAAQPRDALRGRARAPGSSHGREHACGPVRRSVAARASPVADGFE